MPNSGAKRLNLWAFIRQPHIFQIMNKEQHTIFFSGKYDIMSVPESMVLHIRVECYGVRFTGVQILKDRSWKLCSQKGSKVF
jgi:hypothetical protein